MTIFIYYTGRTCLSRSIKNRRRRVGGDTPWRILLSFVFMLYVAGGEREVTHSTVSLLESRISGIFYWIFINCCIYGWQWWGGTPGHLFLTYWFVQHIARGWNRQPRPRRTGGWGWHPGRRIPHRRPPHLTPPIPHRFKKYSWALWDLSMTSLPLFTFWKAGVPSSHAMLQFCGYTKEWVAMWCEWDDEYELVVFFGRYTQTRQCFIVSIE